MGSLYESFRRFLFGWANREFLIFLFFVALAGIFWLLTTLNESYEQELKIPVRFVNVPHHVVITSGEDDTLRVTVRDKGISLITYLYAKNKQPVYIDFNRYNQGNGTGEVPASDLLRLAGAKLPASAKAISVKPDVKEFYYNNGEKKIVPVAYQGEIEPDMLHFIASTTYSPDSITIYASEEMLDSIKKVYTKPLHYKDFIDSLVVSAELQPIEGVKMVPNRITVCFQTDMLAEVSIEGVPVVGINMPPGTVLRTFPAKLTVHFVAGMKNYHNLTPADFLIVADYNELKDDTSAKCNVYLRQHPDGIQRVRLETEQVDYLIEEK